jgi:membrane-bound metal-dependent hydrolase YbcI (DUF457 family)
VGWVAGDGLESVGLARVDRGFTGHVVNTTESMFPWGHAAVGYLLYAGHQRLEYGLRPHDAPVLALAIGTQLPDLIDKPLTYLFAVLPSGRSLGHSLLFAALLVGVVWLVARQYEQRSLVGAFGIGYVSHLFGDALYPALAGRFGELGFLAYPLTQPTQYEVQGGFVGYLMTTLFALDPTPTFLFELALTAVALGLWYRDGLPGLQLLLPDSASRFIDRQDQ